MNIYGFLIGKYLPRIIGIGSLVVVWQICSMTGIINPLLLPAFSDVIVGLWQLVISGKLVTNMLASLSRAMAGFALAALIAIPTGIMMGWSERFEEFFDYLLQICRNTPTLALYPILILAFGLGELSKISIIAWGAIWPMFINAIGGVKAVDSLLLKAAKSMATPPFAMFQKIILPAALPSIVAGVRLSAGRAMILLVGAELMGAHSGLGYLIFDSRNKFNVAEMYASILVLTVLGVGVNYLLVMLEQYVNRWQGVTEKI